ncbi:MAG: hypothetical protein ACR2L1_02535 [Pyrinomonadaceae bacterium]
MAHEESKLPNDVLAGLIIEKLDAENLILHDKLGEIEKKIALGTARPEDWRLWVEMNLPALTGGQKDE